MLVHLTRRSWLVAAAATLAGFAIDAELTLTAPGPAAGAHWLVWLIALVLVPLAALVLIGAALIGVPALLLAAIQSKGEGRSWALARCALLVASAGTVWLSAGVVAPELRLWRLARATAELTSSLDAYAADRAAGRLTTPPPALDVRGCSALALSAPGDGSWELSATCPGWFGTPDEIRYRPGGYPTSESVRQLGGGWMYVWN